MPLDGSSLEQTGNIMTDGWEPVNRRPAKICESASPEGRWRKESFRQTSALLRRDPRHRIDRLDLGGAELELGDFAERIELRVRQQVRRRLDIGERNEHHAVG